MSSEDTKEEDANIHVKEEPTPGCYLKARYVVGIMGFFAVFNLISIRNNLSVAIVAMVNYTNKQEDISNSSQCPDRGSQEIDDITSNGQFNWNSAEQGLVLGCYFYGYIWTGIPGGYLAKRFGFRLILGTSMFLGSVITLLTPLVANTSFELFVAFRILLGFVQGVATPSYYAAFSKWAPPLERSKFTAMIQSGASFGIVVVLPISGIIAENLGWEWVFYITGGFALLWTLIFVIIIRDCPEEHPRISEQEKKYIVESINQASKKNTEEVKVRTPWLAMLTSLPLWGIMIADFASIWGNYILNTLLPTYMSSVLGFSLSASGALSSLPYVMKFIVILAGGWATDAIRKRNFNLTILRKINTSLGMLIPALFIALAGYIGCNAAAAVAFFTLSAGFSGFIVPGLYANTLDIAPKYSGITFGMTNALGNIAGFLSPQVAGLMLVDGSSVSEWQNVFWLSAGMYCIGAVTYLILGTAEEQPWAAGKVITTKKESEIAYIGPLDENKNCEMTGFSKETTHQRSEAYSVL